MSQQVKVPPLPSSFIMCLSSKRSFIHFYLFNKTQHSFNFHVHLKTGFFLGQLGVSGPGSWFDLTAIFSDVFSVCIIKKQQWQLNLIINVGQSGSKRRRWWRGVVCGQWQRDEGMRVKVKAVAIYVNFNKLITNILCLRLHHGLSTSVDLCSAHVDLTIWPGAKKTRCSP